MFWKLLLWWFFVVVVVEKSDVSEKKKEKNNMIVHKELLQHVEVEWSSGRSNNIKSKTSQNSSNP